MSHQLRHWAYTLRKHKFKTTRVLPGFTAALFTIARTRKQSTSIDRGVDKEAVVHTRNGVLLSHKKEHGRVSFSESDELGACYTE